jgi:hypothetical protein
MEMSLKQYIPFISAERVFQAIEAIKYAKSVGASATHTEAQAQEMTKSVLI